MSIAVRCPSSSPICLPHNLGRVIFLDFIFLKCWLYRLFKNLSIAKLQLALMDTPLSHTSLSYLPIYCPQLPFAVYQEIATHLRQVVGITVEILPQQSQQFDYAQSQVGGLQVFYAAETDSATQQRVEQILAYYGDRYGAWKPLEGQG